MVDHGFNFAACNLKFYINCTQQYSTEFVFDNKTLSFIEIFIIYSCNTAG